MRHLFIINPHSFMIAGVLERLLIDLQKYFSASGKEEDLKIYVSRYPRDAIAVIHRYVSAAPPDETVRVYAVGGDGILYDCLNGVVDFQNAELSAIPYGNANDFIRAFGEGAFESFRDIKKMAKAVSRPVDVINLGFNYALNEVSFGIESQSIIDANALSRMPSFKLLRKHPVIIYYLGALHSFFNKEVSSQEYQVTLDGEDYSGCYCNISISNSACIGGSMISNPYARPDSGSAEVMFLKSGGGILSLIKALAHFSTGRFEKNSRFFRKPVHEMEVKSDIPIRVSIDGETFYSEEIKIEILPARIKFFAPEGMDFKDYSYKAYSKTRKGGATQ